MKILFKSKESDIISAALRWQKSLMMDREVKYFERQPYYLGETPEHKEVSKPTGLAITHIDLTKDGFTYCVFTHDLFGIVIARKE